MSGGKIRVIGITSPERIASAPGVAVMAEGLSGFVATNDLFLLAPAGTPPATIQRISSALKAVLATAQMRDGCLAQGAIVEWIGPEELAQRIRRDIESWSALSKEAGIQPQ